MPADPHDIAALIAALQDAAEGSRELDERIALCVGWAVQPDGQAQARIPAYSTSLDAAVTLTQDSADWLVRKAAQVLDGKPAYALAGKQWAWAATPALAMCCAALRARSAG